MSGAKANPLTSRERRNAYGRLGLFLISIWQSKGEMMATVIAKNEALTVFESSDGQAYVCRFDMQPNYEHKNELVRQLRDKLKSISPEAYSLAKAFAAIAAYKTTDVEQAINSVCRGEVKDTTVQIKEGDQLIFRGDVEDAPQTPFIADLIRDALRSADGLCEREDAEGCLVTCVVNG